MKDVLVGMMVKMMPFMMPVLWFGAAMLGLGIVLLILARMTGSGNRLARLAGLAATSVGIFFIACQIAGTLLDVPPSINFGDSRKFEFVLVPFWQIGLGLLIPGLLLRLLSGRSKA